MIEVFRRKANRVCIDFGEYGLVPLAEEKDDAPKFVTQLPKRIGDDVVIYVEGKYRKVRLLKSIGHVKNQMYLVDMGSLDS